MTRNTILTTLCIFCIFGIWAPRLQGSVAPYYEVQTAWYSDPPASQFIFIQNTSGVNSWGAEDPDAVEGVAINDNLNSAGVGTPSGGFRDSQGGVLLYYVPGSAGNGGFCAYSSEFPTSEGGPGGSGLPTDLGEAIIHVDIAFEVPDHSDITYLSQALNFWVAEADGDYFELPKEDCLDLTTKDWQTYTYDLSTVPLEFPGDGEFGDSAVTLVSIEFEDPTSPSDLENILFFVDNFRIESYGETLFFEDFEPQTVSVTDTIEFFDESVENEDLEGEGPGNSAKNRLKAFRNMLERASNLIGDEKYEEACDQLQAAYKKCDGQPKPPDFVTGEAVGELANRIMALMESLNCE